jgi:hypothetical protein
MQLLPVSAKSIDTSKDAHRLLDDMQPKCRNKTKRRVPCGSGTLVKKVLSYVAHERKKVKALSQKQTISPETGIKKIFEPHVPDMDLNTRFSPSMASVMSRL